MSDLPAPPSFAELSAYGERLGDVDFWAPYVRAVLSRHDLADRVLESGFVGTFPTFLAGDVVVKLFGCFPSWRSSYTAELAAHRLLDRHTEIPAARVLGHGQLYDSTDSWPYLITTRLHGTAWRDANLPHHKRIQLATTLGPIVEHVHRLAPDDPALTEDWADDNRAGATERHRQWGSLPGHLVDQIESYVDEIRWSERILVHADLTEDHVFVDDDGELVGVIDWGDVLSTDRHYELGALYFGMFDSDPTLLRAFLESYGWQIDNAFPRRTLGLALLHQFDVFAGVRSRLPLDDIGTLDELAVALYDVSQCSADPPRSR